MSGWIARRSGSLTIAAVRPRGKNGESSGAPHDKEGKFITDNQVVSRLGWMKNFPIRISKMTSRIPLVFGLVLLLSVACSADSAEPKQPTVQSQPVETTPPAQPIGDLLVRIPEPVGIDFTADGRMYYIARQLGEIRWIDTKEPPVERPGPGKLFATLDIFEGSECGLLGLALDPEFELNHYVYVYAIEPDLAAPEGAGKPRIIRFTELNGVAGERVNLVDDLPFTNPKTCAHVGGTLRFGPDGFLYLSLGNNERKETSADLSSPLGKILRLNKADGSAAPGNPFENTPEADSRIYAYGFRNPFGYAFHPEVGAVYVADNGPGNCDELNVVEAGGFYGAPDSLPASDAETCLGLGGIDPIHLFSMSGKEPTEFPSNVAPAGLSFVSGSSYVELGTGLLVCEFLTQDLRYFRFAGPAQAEVADTYTLLNGCRFSVAVDSAGTFYYSSKDAIWRVTPEHLSQR